MELKCLFLSSRVLTFHQTSSSTTLDPLEPVVEGEDKLEWDWTGNGTFVCVSDVSPRVPPSRRDPWLCLPISSVPFCFPFEKVNVKIDTVEVQVLFLFFESRKKKRRKDMTKNKGVRYVIRTSDVMLSQYTNR